MKKTLSIIISFLLCICIMTGIYGCSGLTEPGAYDLPGNTTDVDTTIPMEYNTADASQHASRENAQDYLKNVDTIWFEASIIKIQGHSLPVTGAYKPSVFDDSDRPVFDRTNVMLESFHEFDISDYPETSEDAETREHVLSAGLEVNGAVCRIIYGENPDNNEPLNTTDRVVTFEFPDGSRFSIELPDNCPPDNIDESSQQMMNGLYMISDGLIYERADIGGDLTVYDTEGNSSPSSTYGAAYVRFAADAALTYGTEVAPEDIDWSKQAVFKDGSRYDFAIEGELPAEFENMKVYVRPYDDGNPSDRAYLIRGFDDDQSRILCTLHTIMALTRGDEEQTESQKQEFVINVDYSSIGEFFITDSDMEIYTDNTLTDPIRASISDPVDDYHYAYSFKVNEIQDTYWVRPALISVNRELTSFITAPLKEGTIIQYEGTDWIRIDEVLVQGRLLTVTFSPCINERYTVPDEIEIVAGDADIAHATTDISFNESNVMKEARYTYTLPAEGLPDDAALRISSIFTPITYTAAYSCDRAELIVMEP